MVLTELGPLGVGAGVDARGATLLVPQVEGARPGCREGTVLGPGKQRGRLYSHLPCATNGEPQLGLGGPGPRSRGLLVLAPLSPGLGGRGRGLVPPELWGA